MDTQDQPWVMGHHAHTYQGDDAVEVTRLVGKMTAAYVHLHLARPMIPFGGYYTLGVCQDSVAAIEKKMTGETTLFPNTADASLFDDSARCGGECADGGDSEGQGWEAAGAERIFGSLPTGDLAAVSIPGLAADLAAAHAAWQSGDLERQPGPYHRIAVWLEWFGVAAAVATIVILMRRRVADVIALMWLRMQR